jgi:hypothetical protein
MQKVVLLSFIPPFDISNILNFYWGIKDLNIAVNENNQIQNMFQNIQKIFELSIRTKIIGSA